MVVGGTVHGAAVKMKRQLEAFAAETFFGGEKADLNEGVFEAKVTGRARSFEEVASACLKRHGTLRVYNQFTLPPSLKWNQKTFEGDAYPSYSWGCNIAEVEIDALTLEIHVKRVTGVYDIGRLINPMLAKGQIEGGLVQALGYAVMEKMEIKNGKYDADRMQTYVIPTMPDIPEFDLDFIEYPYTHAAPGAKGVGEIPMDGLAPAVANAVKAATGIRIRDLPITPEKLFAAMRGNR
jgi:CO/xanthine dehydrogenase Mo-binding subunit